MGNDEPYCPSDYPPMKAFQRAAKWLMVSVLDVMAMAARGEYLLINRAAMYLKAEEDAVAIAEQWNS